MKVEFLDPSPKPLVKERGFQISRKGAKDDAKTQGISHNVASLRRCVNYFKTPGHRVHAQAQSLSQRRKIGHPETIAYILLFYNISAPSRAAFCIFA